MAEATGRQQFSILAGLEHDGLRHQMPNQPIGFPYGQAQADDLAAVHVEDEAYLIGAARPRADENGTLAIATIALIGRQGGREGHAALHP